MRKLCIAIGSSRKAQKWENKEVTWEWLKERLNKPIVTNETIEEYLAMSDKDQDKELLRKGKAKQDNIKDVGGYVGGYSKDGKRNQDSISYRDLLSLDFDHCSPEIYKKLSKLDNMGIAYISHSTHKHVPESPRLRIIIPLEVKLSSKKGEYEQFSKNFVESIDLLDMVDPISFERNRLMYWPSTAKNGEYYYKAKDGKFLNWLPYLEDGPKEKTEKDKKETKEKAKKGSTSPHNKEKKKWYKKDPRTCKGIIGAFCRTYPISKCIRHFLSDIYSGPDERKRYTYIPGSGASGVVIKDDDTLFQSFHSTDPARTRKGEDKPRECNSFDLIMIHMFDDDQNRLKEAIIWASEQEDVQDDEILQSEKPAWDKERVTKGGCPILSKSNLEVLLEWYDIELSYNEMLDIRYINGEEWQEEDLAYIKDLCLKYKMANITQMWMELHLNQIAKDNLFHPIKNYLESLKWDGVKRVDTLLSTYFDAEDSKYTRACIRKVLAGAVKRIYDPGCEFQYVLVFTGKTGIGKSHFWELLAGEWFSDDLQLTDMQSKTGTEKLIGNWIVELPELSGMRKMEVEAVKAFITRRADNCRLAYRRDPKSLKRQSIMVGTTNNTGYLKDPEGNRRFLTIEVNNRKTNDLPRDQIWAEVMGYYKNEELKLSRELSYEAEKIAQKHMDTDNRTSYVAKFLDIPIPEWKIWNNFSIDKRREYIQDQLESVFENKEEYKLVERGHITPIEIWCECFGRPVDMLKRQESNELVLMLISLGWTEKKSVRDKAYGIRNDARYRKK